MPALAHVGVPQAPDRGSWSGAGATVCVIDSGLDVRHADFRDPAGRTRVRWLLDLSAPPRGIHARLESAYEGAVWSARDLDDALARGGGSPTDDHGHGTAVASLAAADGSSAEGFGELAGAAPAAALVIVKALRAPDAGFLDDDIVQGARFCVEVEERAGTTAIVIALGNHDGGHDGADPIERALALLADRAPIVVAAGNDTIGAHVRGQVAGDLRRDIAWEIPASEGAARAEAVFVLDPDVRLSLRAPDGVETEEVAPGEEATRVGSGAMISVLATDPPRPDDARLFRLRISSPPGLRLQGRTYDVRVRGSGSFHGWIAGSELPEAFFAPRFSGSWVDRSVSVMVPATAPSVIAVGASITQDTIATDETTLSMIPRSSGPAAWFSPEGPTRSGVPKPDVLAPGGWNIAALSGDVSPYDRNNFFGGSQTALNQARIGVDHIAVRGTSQAAPIVAGGIALTLARHPWLGRTDARRACATAQRSDGVSAWDPVRGCGTFHVPSWIASSMQDGGLPDPQTVQISSVESFLSESTRRVHVVIRAQDAAGLPAEGALALAIDQERIPVEIHRGVGEATVEVHDSSRHGGVLIVHAELEGQEVARLSVPIARSTNAQTCAIRAPGWPSRSCPCGMLAGVFFAFAFTRNNPCRKSRRESARRP